MEMRSGGHEFEPRHYRLHFLHSFFVVVVIVVQATVAFTSLSKKNDLITYLATLNTHLPIVIEQWVTHQPLLVCPLADSFSLISHT